MGYIKRSDAIMAAQYGADKWDGGINCSRDKAISEAIEALPAADVRPVVRANEMGTNTA